MRKGEGMSPILWIVLAVVLVLGAGLFGFKGLNYVGLIQGTITGAGGEFVYQSTGDFPKVCDDWQASPEKYTPAYILGGAFRPSVTGSANNQGPKFKCCWDDMRVAAEKLKSQGKSFNSDEEGWEEVNKCIDACEFVSNTNNDCRREYPGTANQKEYVKCMTDALGGYHDCE